MTGQAERLLELKGLQDNRIKSSSQKIFAFTSGKGGTGKTFLSLNIAYVLSEKGKKILFLDLDSNLSNANILLNEIASKTMYGFFNEQKLLNELITEYKPNLHFIFGDSGRLNYPVKRSGIVSKLFSQLRQMQNNYDFIFLDTGSGAGDEILSVLLNADSNIIVTSTEPTAVMDSYVMLKLLNANRYSGNKLIIVNKCFEEEDGQVTFNNLTMAANHFLKDKLFFLGEINFDKLVSKSIISQELFLKTYSGSPAANQIEKIAAKINKITHVANNHQTEFTRVI